MTIPLHAPISGIYQITNTTNGDFYIGSAVNFKARWRAHRSGFRTAKHANQKLLRAWQAYGEGYFTFSVIEYVADISILLAREQHYIDTLNPAYNMCRTVIRTRFGLINSPEHRANISAARMGHSVSAEQRLKMSIARKGIPLSPECLAKLKGRKLSPGHVEKYRNRIVSAETRAKLSVAGKGKVRSAEARAHISTGKKGRPRSPEHSSAYFKAMSVTTERHCYECQQAFQSTLPPKHHCSADCRQRAKTRKQKEKRAITRLEDE